MLIVTPQDPSHKGVWPHTKNYTKKKKIVLYDLELKELKRKLTYMMHCFCSEYVILCVSI